MKIYMITNRINNKKYVGQTIQPIGRRWARHLSSGNALFGAVKKYGKENFSIEVIDTASSIEELNQKEIDWIKKLNTLSPNGYNLKSGGHCGGTPCAETLKRQSLSHIGKKISLETRKKMSEAQKLAQLRPEVVEAKRKRMTGNKYTTGVVPWNKGIAWPKEIREKLSKANMGKTPWLGKRHSKESIAKISANNWMKGKPPENHPMFGKKHSAETRKKMSELRNQRPKDKHPMIGRHHSAESKLKMSESAKRRCGVIV